MRKSRRYKEQRKEERGKEERSKVSHILPYSTIKKTYLTSRVLSSLSLPLPTKVSIAQGQPTTIGRPMQRESRWQRGGSRTRRKGLHGGDSYVSSKADSEKKRGRRGGKGVRGRWV